MNADDIAGDDTDPTPITDHEAPPLAELPATASPAIHAAALAIDDDALASLAVQARTTADGVPLDQILADRPDVFAAFYSEYYGPNNDHHSSAWVDRVGGTTPEDYANYWYATSGKAGGYVPSTGVPVAAAAAPEEPAVRTTSDGIALDQILTDRPDVFGAYYSAYYGPNNDHHSSAWVDRVGGTTAEDYANYWYTTSGKAGGYVPSTGVGSAVASSGRAAPLEPGSEADSTFTFTDTGRTTIDGIKISQIFQDRPDVYRAFFTEYYGPNNDHHSSAWVDRVGGTTPEDYANYWYNSIGKIAGYVPSTHLAAAPAQDAGDGPASVAPDDAAPQAEASGSPQVPDIAAQPDPAPAEPTPVAPVDPGSPAVVAHETAAAEAPHLTAETAALLDPATKMAVESYFASLHASPDGFVAPLPELDPFGLV